MGGIDMKLTKVGVGQLLQTREVAGLLSCSLEYEVKSGKGRLNYTGPKFSPDMWHQVLSFFRWTHQEMDSESQLRLYVNTKVGRWGAWAFPQEARTGLSAKEIAVQESPDKARERFASWDAEPSDDWVYFCTVHHHCSASAFQSGTDEDNERNQDGLHITVGRIDSDRHDLHARFYLDGNCFDPDMSLFWPLAPELVEKLPASVLDELARFQMCEKVTVAFPDAWRANVIEAKPEGKARRQELHGLWATEFDRRDWERLQEAITDMDRGCRLSGFSDEQLIAALQTMTGNSVENVVMQACLDHGVIPEDLLTEITQMSF
jgi:hypothetical protein